MPSGAHILIKFGGGELIVGLTFRIPIYRYRHNQSQNNFTLFVYSNPIDVIGTDFLLFIGLSGLTFYAKLLILGGGTTEAVKGLQTSDFRLRTSDFGR